MTIQEGDGTMERRIAVGLCPKCQTAIPEEPRIKCSGCGLEVVRNKAQDEQEPPVVIRMKRVR